MIETFICTKCGAEYSAADWERLPFHAHWVSPGDFDLELRNCACRGTMARDFTEDMMKNDHMIVGYDPKHVAIAVGYGADFDDASAHYERDRNRRSIDRPIVTVVRYRKTESGWEEVRDVRAT